MEHTRKVSTTRIMACLAIQEIGIDPGKFKISSSVKHQFTSMIILETKSQMLNI